MRTPWISPAALFLDPLTEIAKDVKPMFEGLTALPCATDETCC